MLYIRYHIVIGLLIVLSGCTGVASVGDSLITKTATQTATQREFGHDFLGAQHPNFDYKSAARVVRQGTPLGFLDGTFSTDLTAPSYLVTHVHPHYVRVHILNTVCVRNSNCGRYEPLSGFTLKTLDAAILARDPKVINALVLRLAKWKTLAAANPTTQFLVSPALEHNLSVPAYRVLADTVLSYWPEVQLVNSAMSGKGEEYRGAWVESHGDVAGKHISSPDGTEVTDMNIDAYKKATRNNIITFKWSRLYNLRNQSNVFTDPRARTKGPTIYQTEEIEHMSDDQPAAESPSFKCNFRKFDSTSIWKPLSENKGTGDVRADKPVLITSFPAGKSVTLVSFDGRTVGTLGYFGSFDKSRNRFYSNWAGGSGLQGYQFQKRAVRLSGYPQVWAKSGGKCIGPFLPGQRQGSFR